MDRVGKQHLEWSAGRDTEEQGYWILRLIRASREQDATKIGRCLDAMPSLQGLTEVQDGNIVKVSIAKACELLSETMTRDIQDQIEALNDSENDHTPNKKNKHNYLVERLHQFSPRCKRKGLQTVSRPYSAVREGLSQITHIHGFSQSLFRCHM